MGNIPSGSKETFSFKVGEPANIGGNRPMKFKIELLSGGYLEGIIPANEKLIICSHGNDFADIQIIIDEDTTAPIRSVT